MFSTKNHVLEFAIGVCSLLLFVVVVCFLLEFWLSLSFSDVLIVRSNTVEYRSAPFAVGKSSSCSYSQSVLLSSWAKNSRHRLLRLPYTMIAIITTLITISKRINRPIMFMLFLCMGIRWKSSVEFVERSVVEFVVVVVVKRSDVVWLGEFVVGRNDRFDVDFDVVFKSAKVSSLHVVTILFPSKSTQVESGYLHLIFCLPQVSVN